MKAYSNNFRLFKNEQKMSRWSKIANRFCLIFIVISYNFQVNLFSTFLFIEIKLKVKLKKCIYKHEKYKMKIKYNMKIKNVALTTKTV